MESRAKSFKLVRASSVHIIFRGLPRQSCIFKKKRRTSYTTCLMLHLYYTFHAVTFGQHVNTVVQNCRNGNIYICTTILQTQGLGTSNAMRPIKEVAMCLVPLCLNRNEDKIDITFDSHYIHLFCS